MSKTMHYGVDGVSRCGLRVGNAPELTTNKKKVQCPACLLQLLEHEEQQHKIWKAVAGRRSDRLVVALGNGKQVSQEIQSGILEILTALCRDWVKRAPRFMEVTLVDDVGELLVTVRKKETPTPGDLLKQAEVALGESREECDRVKAELARLRAAASAYAKSADPLPPSGIDDLGELQKALEQVGYVQWAARLPDGSGAATASFGLPDSHWLYRKGANVPPMPLRMGTNQKYEMKLVGGEGCEMTLDYSRQNLANSLKRAGRYAIRCATMNGTEPNFDPDALLLELVVGLLGYKTSDGYSPDAYQNPGAEGDAARFQLAEENNDPDCVAAALNY